MYKLKYYYLKKEEKQKLKEDFYKTEFGKNIKNRLNRLFITGILALIFSIYLFISYQTKWDIVTAIILVIAAFTFIWGSFKVRIDKLNNFLVKQNKKK